MEIHLYALVYRVEALVASNLPPEQFGNYMAVGPKRLTGGNVVFFEVDPNLTSDYFRLDNLADRVVPDSEGSPKRSLYISIYRVLEHLSLDAMRELHLVTRDGKVLAIAPAAYDSEHEKTEPHLYQELSPVTPFVASILGPAAFSRFITDPSQPIYVPRILFADMLADRDETGRLASSLPYGNPEHIQDCLEQLSPEGKKTKIVDRAHPMEFFYRTIRRGFFLGDQTGLKFYPFPTLAQLQREYHSWWKSASLGL